MKSKRDAETLLAKTAKSYAEDSSVVFISEDTCFGILLHYWNPGKGDICCKRQETFNHKFIPRITIFINMQIHKKCFKFDYLDQCRQITSQVI